MKNLKYEFYAFNKALVIEQDDIRRIVDRHNDMIDVVSEKRIISCLKESMQKFMYDESVKHLVESLEMDYKEHSLVYDLKDLYKLIESKDIGLMYRQPLNTLLQIINLDTDQDRMEKVLNELCIYDWVPEIKVFLYNMTKNPQQRENLMSGGKINDVYTIVEQVEEGFLAFIKDAWFLIGEDKKIEKTILENHIKDEVKLRALRTLETALHYSELAQDMITFKISENLEIGLCVDKPGMVYINGEEANKETTLESLFSSPLIPIINKNFFPLIMEVSQNLDKFVNLDIVKKITNLANPFIESFAFNYKGSPYLYRCDSRYATSFYKFEGAIELVNEIKNDLSADLTYFFKNTLSKEIVVKKELEDKERQIRINLDDIIENKEKVETTLESLGGSDVLKEALKMLNKKKKALEKELEIVKELQYKEIIQK